MFKLKNNCGEKISSKFIISMSLGIISMILGIYTTTVVTK